MSAIPWIAACQASLSITNCQSLRKLMSIEPVMPSPHLILCHPLFLLPLIFPSIRIFSNESVLCIWWLKYWSFSFSITPSSEYSGLISFRIDWFDFLTVQGVLKSLLEHHSSKLSQKALVKVIQETWNLVQNCKERVNEIVVNWKQGKQQKGTLSKWLPTWKSE